MAGPSRRFAPCSPVRGIAARWSTVARGRHNRECGRSIDTRSGRRARFPNLKTRGYASGPKVAAEVEARLRIIDPDLARAVDARLKDRRTRYLAAREAQQGRAPAPHKTHGRYLLSGGMLICPTCGGNFEARKNPWREREPGGHQAHVYICSTRRRKPGVCANTLALPIDATDDAVLSRSKRKCRPRRSFGS